MLPDLGPGALLVDAASLSVLLVEHLLDSGGGLVGKVSVLEHCLKR